MTATLEIGLTVSCKIEHTPTCDPAISLPSYLPKRNETYAHAKTCM